MTVPVFAAAQSCACAGNIAENVRRHLLFMRSAHQRGAQFLIFPELSLTGYEPTLAAPLAQGRDSPFLAPLRDYAREAKMTTVVGLPLLSEGREQPLIAACVLHADGALTVHTKQHLHTGEEQYFSAGIGGDLLRVAGMPLALSICADFGHATHAAAAASAGARLYAASVLVGEGGHAADSATLQGYASHHQMAVLMANHGGPTGGWPAAGRSVFWDERGAVVVATPGPGNQLLFASKNSGGWEGWLAPVEITE